MINFVNFSTENHLLSILGSGLNLIFHSKTHSLIFVKSMFKSFAAEFIFLTTAAESYHTQIVLGSESNHQINH